MRQPNWNKHPYLHKLACIFVLFPIWFVHCCIESVRAGFRKFGRVWGELDDILKKYPKKPLPADNVYHV
jgi:hypothetical protein